MSPQARVRMQNVGAFVRLSRPKFLLGGFAGFALGAAVAAYEGRPVVPAVYIAGQAMITAFHLMTHYANDYFDRHTDVRTQPSEFAGGSGVLVSGALAPRVALVAARVCAGFGTLGVAGFALAGKPVAAGLGAAIGLLAWCYSAPPLRLAASGWGEIDTTAVVAVLVPLAGYATFAGSVDALALSATAAPACAMLAMMIAVEWPDRAADAAGDKRNLIVRFGSPAMARFAAACAVLTVPALGFTLACGAPPTSLVFSALLVPPVAGFARRIVKPRTGADEVAATGVTVFLLTVVFALFGYLTALR